jgi:hypothetical protein
MNVVKMDNRFRGFPKFTIMVKYSEDEYSRFNHMVDGLYKLYGKPDDVETYIGDHLGSMRRWGYDVSNYRLYFETDAEWFDAQNKI